MTTKVKHVRRSSLNRLRAAVRLEQLLERPRTKGAGPRWAHRRGPYQATTKVLKAFCKTGKEDPILIKLKRNKGRKRCFTYGTSHVCTHSPCLPEAPAGHSQRPRAMLWSSMSEHPPRCAPSSLTPPDFIYFVHTHMY